MIAPLALLTFAIVVGVGGSHLLAASHWPSRAPGLAILTWLALSLSVLSSLVLAGLSLAMPEIPATEGVAGFFDACSIALRDHYSTPGGATLSIAGGAFALLLTLRTVSIALRGVVRRRRTRRHQLDLIDVVARPYSLSGVVVLDHPSAAVYCVPGRPGRIVVTEGALAALSPSQLQQVLRHETAHLRRRHHITIATAEVLAATLFNRLGTGSARQQIAELAEMQADDAARGNRLELARAVLLLAGGTQPIGALGAAGGCAHQRVRRLRSGEVPLLAPQRVALWMMLLATAAVPFLLALAPAADAMVQHYCPLIG